MMMRKGFVGLFLIHRHVAYLYVVKVLLQMDGSWRMESGLACLEKDPFFQGEGKEEEFLLEKFKYMIGCCERFKITYHTDCH